MTRKVRRIDWYPDEYIAGTFGRLTFEEHGAYGCILNMISSSGGPIEADYKRIAHAANSDSRLARRLVAQLVSKGKLVWTDDGRLTNGRAMLELGRALKRVDDARHAASAPRTKPSTSRSLPEVKAKSTGSGGHNFSKDQPISDTCESERSVTNQPPTTNHEESDALPSGRASARARKSSSRIINGGPEHDDGLERLARDWRPTEDQREFARDLGLDPDAVAETFVVYWVEGKGKRERRSAGGWNLTWRNWCRRDAERSGRGAPSSHGQGHRPARGGGIVGAALRLRARHRNQ